MDFSEI